jgi:hypothetical protein
MFCCSRLFLVVIFGALSWWFLGVFSGPCSWRFDGRNLCEPFVVLLPLIPLPNPRVKGLDFGVFGVLGLEMLLRVDFRFLLIEWVLGIELLAKGSPRGTPTIPKSHFDLWNESGDQLVEGLSFSRGLCSSRMSK